MFVVVVTAPRRSFVVDGETIRRCSSRGGDRILVVVDCFVLLVISVSVVALIG